MVFLKFAAQKYSGEIELPTDRKVLLRVSKGFD